MALPYAAEREMLEISLRPPLPDAPHNIYDVTASYLADRVCYPDPYT